MKKEIDALNKQKNETKQKVIVMEKQIVDQNKQIAKLKQEKNEAENKMDAI